MNKKILVLSVMLLFSINFIFAFGVSMPYAEDKQFYVSPGQTQDMEFVLQNDPGAENISVGAKIIEGSDIISFVNEKDSYMVVSGVHTPVEFKLAISLDTPIGTKYHVKLAFSTIDEGTGEFAFGSEIEQNFDVIVGEKPKPAPVAEPPVQTTPEKTNLTWLWILIIAIVIVVILVLIRVTMLRKKK